MVGSKEEQALLQQLEALNDAVTKYGSRLDFPQGSEFHLLKYNQVNWHPSRQPISAPPFPLPFVLTQLLFSHTTHLKLQEFQEFLTGNAEQCQSYLDRLSSFFPQGRPRDLDSTENAFTDPDSAYGMVERMIDCRVDRTAAALSQLQAAAKGGVAAGTTDTGAANVTAAGGAGAGAGKKKPLNFDVVGSGPRPQALFEEQIDNTNNPFRPRPWYERLLASRPDHTDSDHLHGSPMVTTTEPIGFKGFQQHPQQAYPHPYGTCAILSSHNPLYALSSHTLKFGT